MDNPPQTPAKSPRFWPMLFIGAFGVGTVLWVIWMVPIILKTRADRDLIHQDPMSATYKPSAPTNSVNPK